MREYSIGTIIDIGENLSTSEVACLTANGSPLTFEKGEVIYRQGDPADDVYFLLAGQAKSVLVNATGGECLLRIHLSHSLMGLTALASTAVRDADGIATTTCETIRIPRPRFADLLRTNADLAVHVTRLLVDRMSDFHHRVGDFLTQNVEQRLAATLLSLSRADPREGDPAARRPVRLTHEELANLLGARRPTITAILNRFSADGLIAKDGRAIEVSDASRLKHLLPRG